MFGVLIVKFVLNLRGRGLRIGDRGLRSALWCIEMVLVGENMLSPWLRVKSVFRRNLGTRSACPRKATQTQETRDLDWPNSQHQMSDSDDDEEDYYQGKLVCPSCGESSLMRNVEEEEDDTTTEDTLSAEQKLERFTHDTCMAMCLSCGAEVEPFDFPWVAKYNHYKVGVVRSVVVFKKRFQHFISTL